MTSGLALLDVHGDVLERNSGKVLVLAHLFSPLDLPYQLLFDTGYLFETTA